MENIKDGIIAKNKDRVRKGELSVKISVKNKINYTNNCDYIKMLFFFLFADTLSKQISYHFLLVST
jgi:hypothetical protein